MWPDGVRTVAARRIGKSKPAGITPMIEHGVAVHLHRTADDFPVGVKAAGPQPIAQNHFVIASGLFLFRLNIAAEHRLYAQQRKQIGGHIQTVVGLGRGIFVAG
jgi:hypothetical protein